VEGIRLPVIRKLANQLLPSRNVRLVDPTRRTLASLAPVYQQETAASIESSGFEVALFNRIFSGRPCTCSRQSSLLDANGNLDQGQIDSLLTGSSLGVRPYGTSGLNNPISNPNPTSGPQLPIITSSKNTLVYNVEQDKQDQVENNEYFDHDEINSDVDGERLYQRQSTPCGICFGTGTVGGFDLLNGRRYVYDVDFPGFTISRGEIDRVATPNAVQLLAGGTVTYQDTWFVSPQNIPTPLLYNNLTIIDSTLYQIAVNGTAITSANIGSFFTGAPVTIKVTALQDIVFTHLEVIAAAASVYADFPDIGDMIDINLADALNQVTIVFPSYYNVTREAIVVDNLLRVQRGWKIISAVPRRNNITGQVYSWECSARVLEKFENTTLLRYPYNDKNVANVMNPPAFPQG